MGSDDEDEAGQAFDVPEQAASHRERPWLCEELVQFVAAMPDPLPPWAQKIWEDFLHHVQEEQDALKFSSTSAAMTSPPAVEVVDESMQEVKGRRKHAGSEGDLRTPQRGRPALRVEEGWPRQCLGCCRQRGLHGATKSSHSLGFTNSQWLGSQSPIEFDDDELGIAPLHA